MPRRMETTQVNGEKKRAMRGDIVFFMRMEERWAPFQYVSKIARICSRSPVTLSASISRMRAFCGDRV